MKTGLLGRKLAHSYSPQIHASFGDESYCLIEKEPEALSDFFDDFHYTGINVTIPYKRDVIPYCDALSDSAARMGAVNTIVRRDDGTLIGHNTDHFGFSDMVRHSGLSVYGKKVLVLGSGGASLTAQKVLQELGANVVVISRTGENNYTNLSKHTDAAVIVNCMPVGMYPNNCVSPLNLDLFPCLEGVLDMIYNPARTKLLIDAEKRGLIAKNGLWMLVAQAKESAEWFRGTSLPDDIIGKVYTKLIRQMENLVLIGMPGSGKSTVGAILARMMEKEFVDADAEIIRQAGKSIPEIFAEGGEEAFRKIETEVLETLGKRSGLVIATGGGCVTRKENYPLLHQNSTIIWLQRDLSLLPTDGRPLSKAEGMDEMYRIRKPMYEAFCDMIADNSRTPKETAAFIAKGVSR